MTIGLAHIPNTFTPFSAIAGRWSSGSALLLLVLEWNYNRWRDLVHLIDHR
jgi:hypothetical protein